MENLDNEEYPEVTKEQVEFIQKLADVLAREQGIRPPSEIPKENWKTLF